jgi:hypothetical protein
MIVKERFKLFDSPNIIQLTRNDILRYSLPKGPTKIASVLEMVEDKVNHFTKPRIYRYLSEKALYRTAVLIIPEYPLCVGWNKPTNQIIINLYRFGIDDIYPNNPDPIDIYALMVYGIAFSNLANGSVVVSANHYPPMSAFLFTLFMRLFGKEYGLSSTFSTELSKLEFLLHVYVLSSFFGVTGSEAYSRASISSSFDFKEYVDFLNNYDFTDTGHFVACLSDFKIMPGITKTKFSEKFWRYFGVDFLPALEDVSRFISIMTCVSIPGSSIVPTYLAKKYNVSEFNKILEISKVVFSRKV